MMRNLLVLAAIGMLAGPAMADHCWSGEPCPYLSPQPVPHPVMTLAPAPSFLTFSTAKGPVSISLQDGHVTLPEGLPMDEASRAFWVALKAAYPNICWGAKP